ncbi:MAG TPA: ABC transporter permease, partial [Ktedonobacterales bacterium]|nr:ABC transporter permease [Ktedonobacterales bacterium]
MDNIFSFSSVKLAQPLLIAALGACALVMLLALRSPYLARIGWRSVGRRRTRTALIVFGLMLSTMFVAASLAVDDTITTAVRTVAVFNLGRIDEDIAGGDGPLHLFPAAYAGPVTQLLTSDPHVAGVAPALTVPNLLVADESARQVRGGVTGFALAGDRTGPLGNLQAANGSAAPAGDLGSRDVYLNRSTGALLNARPGDALYLYSTLWPGHRYRFTVSAIVTGGPLGDAPAVVLPLATLQQLTSAQDEINHIYVANAGDGLTGVGYSDEITSVAYAALQGNLRVDEVKQDGVQLALRAQDIFGRILTLYTSFALALGLLLIFLIFVLLAAERRAELGMARALGMRRGHVVGMLLLEGATYDGVAAALGILSGLGLGLLVVKLVSPTLTQIGFPLQISVQTQSVVVAFCLGLVFTLATIWLAAWTVSRMTVAAALRDLPEPPSPAPSLFGLARALVVALSRVFISPRLLPTAALRLAWGLTARG